MQDEVSVGAWRWVGGFSGTLSPALATSVLLATLMLTVSVLGWVLRDSRSQMARVQVPILEEVVPRVIGRWKEVASDKVSLVYPQTRELLDKLYSQTLARVYENDRGDRIMLSLAYGEDQRGSLRAHKPEVCYPSQGFELAGVEPIHLITPWGPIAARRLITRQGSRDEPVTYWFVMDHQAVRGTFEQRWVEFRAALEGRIPDGLLFRVSSVDPQASRAFELQEEFAQSLLAAVSPAARRRLAGLGG